jgi:hypothetical protein
MIALAVYKFGSSHHLMQGCDWHVTGALGLLPSTDVLSDVLTHIFDTIPSEVTRSAGLIAGTNPSAWPARQDKETENQTRFLHYLCY